MAPSAMPSTEHQDYHSVGALELQRQHAHGVVATSEYGASPLLSLAPTRTDEYAQHVGIAAEYGS
eukprot:CAMPEP_0198345820 /NCGR_PEP_ID=MMETSP1450-20131203/76279_1 /TAXON_ID=753684 ORGANISM="Madagascaria erythrocladiodes, Strain CCMP3234" /NCGR_SAMPLE_ID=MMETSP1450 /ASSEMBLY_ACC=CAM_ASM_001115 /LENGTH=64 /DNA_ID=CAMNT_0044051191 /DNA_START=38 /DNA_END=228 /DNA_ORIENTATION=-